MNIKGQININSQAKHKKSCKNIFLAVLKIVSILIVLIFVLGAILIIPQISKAKNIYQYALAGKQNLDAAQNYANKKDFAAAAESFRGARYNFQKAKLFLDNIYFPKFLYKTSLGKQYVAVDSLLVSSIRLSDAFYEISNFIDNIHKPLEKENLKFSELTIEQRRNILDKLFQSKSVFKKIKTDLDITAKSLEKISAKGLAKPLADIVLPLKENIPKFQKLADIILPITDVMPQLTGYPEPRTYLFLLQNNHELRPSGGFIGTYGIIKVKDGGIIYFKTDDIYNLDFPAQDHLKIFAPKPIQKYMNQKYWFMRDANWSPDFPMSARKVEWFYHLEGGKEKKIDGVIAITPDFIQSLMALVGDITVEGITFSANNFVNDLEYQVEVAYLKQGIPSAQRKLIIGKLANKLIDKLFDLPLTKWLELENIVETSLNEKRFLIFDKDINVSKILKYNNWDGRVKNVESDYLMVVDANMASLKTDSVVDKEINYQIKQNKNNDLIAKVSITYRNKGKFTWHTTRLRTYTRVFVPLGSKLIKGEGMGGKKIKEAIPIDIGEDLKKTYFGSFISIDPGESRTLSFEYKLPFNISGQIAKEGKYKLLIQKQAGTTGHNLKVSLNFNKDIKSYKPTGFSSKKIDNKNIIFDSNLKLDREFEIIFK